MNINWQQINTIFFDMDGTLLDLHFDNHFWLEVVPSFYANKNNLTLDDAKQQIAKKTQKKLGSLDWYCTDYWSRALDMDIIKLKTTVQHKIKLRPSILEFLNFLQNKRLLLVTNAHPNTLEFKMCRVQLSQFFVKIISSHDLNLAKEQLGFWDKFQTIESFNVNHTLLIDDSIAVLTAAKNYGFKYLLGISRPDLSAKKIHSTQFNMIDNFKDLIT